MIFVGIILYGQTKNKLSWILGFVGILFIYFIVSQLEQIYKEKGWYGPRMAPPDGYSQGPLSRDQGNNI